MQLIIIIVVVFTAIAAGFFWWRWKRGGNKRLQNVLMITEDMRIVEYSFPVELGYCIQENWRQAWIIAPECQIRKRGTLSNWLVVHERDASPQAITAAAAKKREKYEKASNGISTEISRIARERCMDSVSNYVSSQNKDKTYDLIKTAIFGLLAVFAVMALIMFGANRC